MFGYLMHKNVKTLGIYFDDDTGRIEDLSSIMNEEHLPFPSFDLKRACTRWWEARSIPNTRHGVASLLEHLRLPESASLLLRNLGVSLTDHYWIKPVDSDLTWETVNLYENSFSDTVGDVQFSENWSELDLLGVTRFSPGASLQGELKKKWLIGQGDKRYLVKGNYGESCQQSLNEVFAAKLHERQKKFPYTTYSLSRLDTSDGPSLGCICENFTDTDREFLPAYQVVTFSKKRNDVSYYEHFINMAVAGGLDEGYIRAFLEYQIATDFICTNTDRHFNNFGLLRDSNTLKYVDAAPIFDTGNSMFWDVRDLGKKYDLLNIKCNSFRRREVDMLSYIQDRNIVDLDRLPEVSAICSLYERDTTMTVERRETLAELYKRKIDIFDGFCHNQDIKENIRPR